MKKSCSCEYSSLCRKREMVEQPQVSYWPRDPGLKPYCKGEEDPNQCSIHSFWDGNPEARENTKNAKRPDISIFTGTAITAIGQFGMWFYGPNRFWFYPGALYTALGASLLTSSISKHYTGKPFFKWLRTRKERSGTQEIYDKILKTADKTGDIDAGMKEKLDGVKNLNPHILPSVRGTSSLFTDARSAEWRGTKFTAWKIRISYPLTEDFSIMQDRDWGIITLYEYEQKLCDNAECEYNSINSYYITGVVAPVINRKRVTNGMGFIDSVVHKRIPMNVSPIIDKRMIGIQISSGVSSAPFRDCGTIDEIFGSQNKLDSAAMNMDDKHAIDAGNLHRLMQEVLYSDF